MQESKRYVKNNKNKSNWKKKNKNKSNWKMKKKCILKKTLRESKKKEKKLKK